MSTPFLSDPQVLWSNLHSRALFHYDQSLSVVSRQKVHKVYVFLFYVVRNKLLLLCLNPESFDLNLDSSFLSRLIKWVV